VALTTKGNEMSTQVAFELEQQANEVTGRTVREQIELNRMTVDHAANETLAQATHPGRWERRGLLQRLTQREPG
jgi:hypothetical protein